MYYVLILVQHCYRTYHAVLCYTPKGYLSVHDVPFGTVSEVSCTKIAALVNQKWDLLHEGLQIYTHCANVIFFLSQILCILLVLVYQQYISADLGQGWVNCK